MAEKDVVLRNYLAIPEVFADLFNGALFKGKQLIHQEELESMDSSSSILIKEKSGENPPYIDIAM